jgi:hypothetical protein
MFSRRQEEPPEPGPADHKFPDLFLFWCDLSRLAELAGLAWLSFGFLYGTWNTRGFRQNIKFLVVREEPTTASAPTQVAYNKTTRSVTP